jgi:hypothetical protein
MSHLPTGFIVFRHPLRTSVPLRVPVSRVVASNDADEQQEEEPRASPVPRIENPATEVDELIQVITSSMTGVPRAVLNAIQINTGRAAQQQRRAAQRKARSASVHIATLDGISDAKAEDGEPKCVGCHENKVKSAYSCGHAVFCVSCAKKHKASGTNQCPVCRREGVKVFPLFSVGHT